jgi:hypothetical protein
MLWVRTLEVNASKLRRIYEELLPTLLLDVDAIEGKLSRRDERDSDYTNHTTMQNVLMGHGGLVAGDNKGLTRFLSLQGL